MRKSFYLSGGFYLRNAYWNLRLLLERLNILSSALCIAREFPINTSNIFIWLIIAFRLMYNYSEMICWLQSLFHLAVDQAMHAA